jgi:putative FmdB family regulatory protein
VPLYEYECRTCGVQFTKLQRFGAAPPKTCPNGHEAVHRLLSEPAIIFKGSGFYVTDHPRNGGKRSSSTSHREKSKEADTSSSEKKGKTN